MSKLPSPQDTEWPEGAIFTVGHSTLLIERFIALLHIYGIKCLADILTLPRSRHNPQFNGDALGLALKPKNIDYVPLPALGGLRRARKEFSEHRLAQHKLSRLRRLHADRGVRRGARNAHSHEPPEMYCYHVRGSGAVAVPPLAGG